MFLLLHETELCIKIMFLIQGSINIVEGGRYKLISDGDNNNMISLAISKVRASDEGEYKLTIENEHGKDEAYFMLYVAGNNSPC